MKIAIPVKMKNENPAVAPLFGKAKWFAVVEDGKIEIQGNPASNGPAVIEWLKDQNVDTIIMQEMGDGPYRAIKDKGGITLYHSGFERILLNEVLMRYENGALEVLDDTKMQTIIAHHEGKHGHGDHHGEGHHGHGHHH